MKEGKLHVVMIPWLAFGHMIPFLELSKCLAKRGHKVSYLSTPRNVERLLPQIPSHLSLLISLVKLAVPRIDGLPENTESTSDSPLENNPYLIEMQDKMEAPTQNFINNQDWLPDCIIYDVNVHWVPRIAQAFGLRCVMFDVASAAMLAYAGPPSVLMAAANRETNKVNPERFTVPPPWITIPTKMAFRYHEALKLIQYNCCQASGVSLLYRYGVAIQGCHFFIIHSCLNFEPEWFHQLAELYQKPILPIGFLSPALSTQEHNANDDRETERLISKEKDWLDTQKRESTVYVAFGSELRFTKEQVRELALGLELSGLPFLWAFRGDATLLPAGFKDRTEGRGMVRFGWSPQTKFLAHTSMGCFFMHGGWGSALEGLSFGLPLVMLPLIADQGLNSRMMEKKGLGVEVMSRNERDGSFTSEAIARALRMVMVESEGEVLRANVKEAKKIIVDSTWQDKYIDDLVHHLSINCEH